MLVEQYRLHNVSRTDGLFAADEEVTCFDGTLKRIFIGTSQGRVLLLDLSTGMVIHTVQLSTNAAVMRIIVAPALGYMVVLSAFTMFNIELETLKPISSSNSLKIALIAYNKDPVVEDPFALQMALATTDRSVLVCINKANNLEFKQKIRTENNVVALSYNKYCICYASLNVYFIYNILESRTLSLFPFDPQIMHPIIVNADKEEFLVNGMQGLGVFVTSGGVSSRPPLIWGTDVIISFAYRSSYVFVLTATSISIYSSGQSTVLQRLPFIGGTLLECVDGQLYICNSDSICLLDEISWLDKAQILVENGEYDEALHVAETAVSNRQCDEAEIQKLNYLRQNVAIAHFKRKEFQKFLKLAVISELDPRQILEIFEFLLPFPSGFKSKQIAKDDFDKFDMESGDVLIFLEQYLKVIRKYHWTDGFCRDLDAVLLRLISKRKDILGAEDISMDFRCTFGDCHLWMRHHKRVKFLISIAFCLADYDNALALCRELYSEKMWDSDITGMCMEFFPKSHSEETLLGWVELMLRICRDDVVYGLKKCSIELDHKKIIEILQDERRVLITYLEEISSLQNAEFHSMLFTMYLEELNVSADKDKRFDEKLNEYRKKLRTFLLQPNKLNLSDVSAALKRRPNFNVEVILLEGAQKKGSFECLHKLLYEHKDYDAAELLCTYADTSDHVLRLTLLKFYLENVTYRPELKLRTISLLNAPTFIFKNMKPLLREIPADWSLSTVLSFAEGTVLSAESHSHYRRLKNAVMARALQTLSKAALKPAYASVRIDEKTKCIACGTPIGDADAACYPHRSQMFHRNCL